MKRSLGKSVTKKIVSVAIAAALILSVATTGVLTTSASDSTGVGLQHTHFKHITSIGHMFGAEQAMGQLIALAYSLLITV